VIGSPLGPARESGYRRWTSTEGEPWESWSSG